jgi:hypothetical protein
VRVANERLAVSPDDMLRKHFYLCSPALAPYCFAALVGMKVNNCLPVVLYFSNFLKNSNVEHSDEVMARNNFLSCIRLPSQGLVAFLSALFE